MTQVISPVTLVDPTLETVAASAQMAPRPESLDGVVIGLLNNGKGKADWILEDIYRMLGERYNLAGSVHHFKEVTSKPFAPEVLDDVASRCQVAITAVGD